MNLQDFVVAPIAKYAIVSLIAYYNFPVATNLASSPRIFNTDVTAYAVISLKDSEIAMLVGYIKTLGFDVEFEFTEGSGKVSLLVLDQVQKLLDLYDAEVGDES